MSINRTGAREVSNDTINTFTSIFNITQRYDLSNLTNEELIIRYTTYSELIKVSISSSTVIMFEAAAIELRKRGIDVDGKGVSYQDSTKIVVMQLEGTPFLVPRINDNGTITIGYGYDFTKKEDPEMFNKYLKEDDKGNIIVISEMTETEASETIQKAADKKGITKGLDDFINGNGYGNRTKSLKLNQNQYDALFSYFYASGQSVFTDSKYNEWVDYGGEYELRAKAREALRDYLISNNDNYDSQRIVELFVNSKGANIRYDYKERRRIEPNLFNMR
jgi:GH24 family phage-related lysozyme (muramidase)